MANTLELIFAAYLVLYVPVRQIWKSLGAKKPVAAALKAERYWRSVRWAGALLLALAGVTAYAGRSLADLGLDFPVSAAGQWGLAAMGVLILAGGVVVFMVEKTLNAETFAEFTAKTGDNDLMPRAGTDVLPFVVMMVALGAAWELLYRGFLMLVLAPLTGTAGAVLLAAVAYGAAHGYSSRGQFIGSIVCAFLFTIAYVLTGSLWWLMVLHIGVPLFGLVSTRRTMSAARRLGLGPGS